MHDLAFLLIATFSLLSAQGICAIARLLTEALCD